jgi:hypothetical protein
LVQIPTAFRKYLDEDRGKHESRTESNEVFQEAFTETVRTGFDENESPDDVCTCGQQSEKEKAREFEIAEERLHSVAVRSTD